MKRLVIRVRVPRYLWVPRNFMGFPFRSKLQFSQVCLCIQRLLVTSLLVMHIWVHLHTVRDIRVTELTGCKGTCAAYLLVPARFSHNPAEDCFMASQSKTSSRYRIDIFTVLFIVKWCNIHIRLAGDTCSGACNTLAREWIPLEISISQSSLATVQAVHTPYLTSKFKGGGVGSRHRCPNMMLLPSQLNLVDTVSAP